MLRRCFALLLTALALAPGAAAQTAAPALTDADRLELVEPETAGSERLTAVFPGGRALAPTASPAAVDALAERLAARLELPGCEIELHLLPGALVLDLTGPAEVTVDALEQLTPLLAEAPGEADDLELALTRVKGERALGALESFERLERGLLPLIYDDRTALGLERGVSELGALDGEAFAQLARQLVSGPTAHVRLATGLDASVAQFLLEGFAADLPDGAVAIDAPAARPAPRPVAGRALNGEPWRLYRDPEPRPEAELLAVLVEGPAPADDPATLAALGAWLEWVTSDEGPLGSQLQVTERASYRLGQLELGRPTFQLRLELAPGGLDARCAALLGPLASPDLALPTAEALERALERRRSGIEQGLRLGLDPLLAERVVRAAAPVPESLDPELAREAGLTWCALEGLWLAAETAEAPADDTPFLFETPWTRTGAPAREALAAMFAALGGEEPFSELRTTRTTADVTIQLADGELTLELVTERRFRPFGHRLEQVQAGRRIVTRIVPGHSDRQIDAALELRPSAEMWQLVGAEERGLQRLLVGLAQRGPVGARRLLPEPPPEAPQEPEVEDPAQPPAADPDNSPAGAVQDGEAPPAQDAPEPAPAPADEPDAELDDALSPLPALLELFDARGPLATLEIGPEGLPLSLVPVQTGPRREYRYSEFSDTTPRLPRVTELPGSRVTRVTELELDPELDDERFEPRR